MPTRWITTGDAVYGSAERMMRDRVVASFRNGSYIEVPGGREWSVSVEDEAATEWAHKRVIGYLDRSREATLRVDVSSLPSRQSVAELIARLTDHPAAVFETTVNDFVAAAVDAAVSGGVASDIFSRLNSSRATVDERWELGAEEECRKAGVISYDELMAELEGRCE